MMRVLTTLGLAAIALIGAAGQASACPACYGSAQKNVLDTYYMSTVMLSLLPFAVVAAIAGLGWLLAGRSSIAVDSTTEGGRRPPGPREPAAKSGNRTTQPAVLDRRESSASRLRIPKGA